MLTRAEIRKLTPKGRTALFDDLVDRLFSRMEDCATALDVERRTLYNWREKDSVPLTALLALHSMAEAAAGAEILKAAEKLGEVAASIERAAQLLVSARPSRPDGDGDS